METVIGNRPCLQRFPTVFYLFQITPSLSSFHFFIFNPVAIPLIFDTVAGHPSGKSSRGRNIIAIPEKSPTTNAKQNPNFYHFPLSDNCEFLNLDTNATCASQRPRIDSDELHVH